MSEHEASGVRAPVGGTREQLKRLLRARVGAGGRFALSLGQRAMWFMQRAARQAWAFNVPVAARITSDVDVEALRRACQALVDRHPALRTTYHQVDDDVLQEVHAEVQLPFEHVAGTGWDDERLLTEVRRRYEVPFNLEQGPVARAHLVTRAPGDHVFLLNVHHLSFDGWSLWTVFEELGALYAAYAAGGEPELPAPAARYDEFVAWQQGLIEGDEGQRHWEYWRERLAGDLPVLSFPTDTPHQPGQAYQGGAYGFDLDRALARRLHDLAQRSGCTMYMLLLSALQLALSRYAGQKDIIVGSAVSGRARLEFERIVGQFVNVIPLRAAVDENCTFAEFLRNNRQTVLDAFEHQALPFQILTQRLDLPRDTSRPPIFQVRFAYQKPHQSELRGAASFVLGRTSGTMELGGLICHPYPLPLQEAQFELGVQIVEAPETLYVRLEFNELLFRASTLQRFGRHFTRLLESIARTPQVPMRELEMSAVDERQQLISLGDARAAARTDKTFPQLFAERAAAQPAAPAVEDESGQLTYAELAARVECLAAFLRRRGVEREARVGVVLERSSDLVVAVLGTLRAGGAFVPMDPDLPDARLAHMLTNAGPTVVLTQAALRARLQGLTQADIVCLDTDWPASGANDSGPIPDARGEDLAYIIYTSGSTGQPKGVQIEHRGLANMARMWPELFGVRPHDRVLQFASISFDAFVSELLMAFPHGATLVLSAARRLSTPTGLHEVLRSRQVTNITLPPSMLAVLPTEGLERLRTVCSAGERCPPEVARKWAPGRCFINGYGPTEVTVVATYYRVTEVDALGDFVSLGNPTPGAQVQLLDAYRRPVPLGVTGEVYIGGAGVGRGYWGLPELTAERFVADPADATGRGRLYRTGDLARRHADGALEFQGRCDQQVKIRGYRVELGDVEARLASHPRIGEVVVELRDDPARGAHLVAYVTPRRARRLELWPSVAEYFVYDEMLYRAMTNDHRRNEAYQAAIRAQVPGKVVLEIGTGPEALLSRFCVAAGARHVYAVELLEDAYQKARATVERLGLHERITLIPGDVMRLQLPELVDVCVSEIVGSIGGAEGAARLINHARRFLRPDGVMIPMRSRTRVAALSLPPELTERPAFAPLAAPYVRRIFEQTGRAFDLRLCLKGVTYDDLLSEADTFEDLDFSRPIELEHLHEIALHITRAGRMDGLLIWLTLETAVGVALDTLRHEHCWLPIYVPFEGPVEVREGDRLAGVISRTLCANGRNPDFRFNGGLHRADAPPLTFDLAIPHEDTRYQHAPFYQRLFADDRVPVQPDAADPPDVGALRSFARECLPEYMVPAAFAVLPEFPRTASGKIDRKALPARAVAEDRGVRVAPRTCAERVIAEIWRDVLATEDVGIDDSFFDLGGHSLLLTKVHARLVAELETTLEIVDLFRFPTIRSLAAQVTSHKTDPTGASTSAEPALEPPSPPGAQGSREIAIIGLAGRFPDAPDLEAFWRNLCAGRESMRELTPEELRSAGVPEEVSGAARYVRAGVVLDGVDQFDAQFFGYAPREAELLDPQQRLFLETCWHALEDAACDPRSCTGRIGLYAGLSANSYISTFSASRSLARSSAGWQAMISNDKDFLPTRVSFKLGLRGPSVNVQTACSTSLAAVHQACQALLQGDCEIALAGGVSVRLPQTAGYQFEDGGVLSADGRCRPFDAAAGGTVPGGGVGVVVLKPLSVAVADGDRIWAVIKGSAINNDGAERLGYAAPSQDGQRDVIRAAVRRAGISAETVEYVETHGTGTPLGDPIEIAALTQAFRQDTPRSGFCALGALKSNIGHLDAAAGVAGLIKAALVLTHRRLPPHANFRAPNPQLRLETTPFFVNTELRDWPAAAHPRRAGVSSFGIGGTNVHVVLEEAPVRVDIESAPVDDGAPALLVLSARSSEALCAQARELRARLAASPGMSLADVAFTLQTGRTALERRWFAVASDVREALEQLERCTAESGATDPAPQAHRVVFLFPGQGSQHVEMARGLYQHESAFRAALDECCAGFASFIGLDLQSVLFPAAADRADAAERLSQTALAQPALFAVEYALAQLWQQWGVRPAAMIGHSIGELVAAALAGVMELPDAWRVVAARGRLMQAMPPGGMLAVELEPAQALSLDGDGLALAAINAPRWCVVSGSWEAIAQAQRACEARGITHRQLRTSRAFHSPAMQDAADQFELEMRKVRLSAPRIPFASNVTGALITAEQATDPAYWAQQVLRTVRFADGLRAIGAAGSVLVEVGPGQALSTLARRQAGSVGDAVRACLPVRGDAQHDVAALLQTVGMLWQRGIDIDWRAMHAGRQRQRVRLPLYPFQRQSYWLSQASELPVEPPRAATPRPRCYLPAWRPSLPPASGSGSATIVVLGEAEDAWTGALCAALRACGRHVLEVHRGDVFAPRGSESWSIACSSAEDYTALVQSIRTTVRGSIMWVHAWTLSEAEGDATALERGFYSIARLVGALTRMPEARDELVILTSGACHSGESAELRPVNAGLIGVQATLALEHPELRSRLIDLTDPAAMPRFVGAVVRELNSAAADPVIALRGGERLRPAFEAVELPGPDREGFKRDGVYVVIGGQGGVGLEIATHLAATTRAKVVLTGRRELPPPESWTESADDARLARLATLRAGGAAIRTYVADATSLDAMRAVLRRTVAEFGCVDGLIFAAGAHGEPTPIATLTSADCAQVFDVRLNGLAVMAELADEFEPSLCLVTSSLASVLGVAGRAAYAAAHAWSDALAARHNATPRRPWLTIDWDVWDTWRRGEVPLTGVAAEGLLQSRDAAHLCEQIVAAVPAGRVLVSMLDLPERWAICQIRRDRERAGGDRIEPCSATTEAGRAGAQRSGELAGAPDSKRHQRPGLSTPYRAPATPTEQTLARIWQELLGFEAVGVDDSFFELGGDSVLSIQLVARSRAAGLAVAPTQVFVHRTIAALATELDRAPGSPRPDAQAVAAPADPSLPPEAWDDLIAQLSPEQK